MTVQQDNKACLAEVAGGEREFVTVWLADQLLGLPVADVQDVLKGVELTRVPMAPDVVAGILNLRGRIVTAINLRTHLGYSPLGAPDEPMSVVVDHNGISYSLVVDRVGDVVSVLQADFRKDPGALDPRIRDVSSGVCEFDDALMAVVDIDRLLDFEMLMVA